MKILRNILLLLWTVVFNPVTIISVISLIIHNNTVVGIRAELGIPYGMTLAQIDSSTHIKPPMKQLGHILNDKWNYAMSDMNMQNLILIVAVILAFYQLINNLLPLGNYNLNKIKVIIKSDTYTILFLTFSLITFGYIFFYVYLGNKSAHIETLQYYLPSDNIITGETRIPPIESIITICRYLIVIYGVISSFFFAYHFPKVLHKRN